MALVTIMECILWMTRDCCYADLKILHFSSVYGGDYHGNIALRMTGIGTVWREVVHMILVFPKDKSETLKGLSFYH